MFHVTWQPLVEAQTCRSVTHTLVVEHVVCVFVAVSWPHRTDPADNVQLNLASVKLVYNRDLARSIDCWVQQMVANNQST